MCTLGIRYNWNGHADLVGNMFTATTAVLDFVSKFIGEKRARQQECQPSNPLNWKYKGARSYQTVEENI